MNLAAFLILIVILLAIGVSVLLVVSLNPKKYALSKALKFEYDGRYKDSIKEYKKLIDQGYLQIENINIIQKIAILYETSGDLHNAREYYQKLIGYHANNLGLNNLELLKKCADLSILLKDNENILRYSIRILLIDKQNSYAVKNIGLTLVKELRFDDALEYLERISHSKHFKKDIEVLYAISLCYHSNKRYTLSIEYLKRSLYIIENTSSKYNDTTLILIYEYILTQMYKEALELILILKNNKMNDNFFLNLSRIHLFVLYKLNLQNEINKEFYELKEILNNDKTEESTSLLYLDMALYSYFYDDIKKSIEYMKDVDVQNTNIDIEGMLKYLNIFDKTISKCKKIYSKDQVTSIQKMMKNMDNEYIDKELSRYWHENLDKWQDSIINDQFIHSLFEMEETCDTKSIFSEEAENIGALKIMKENNEQKDKSTHIYKIHSLEYHEFKTICKNIIQKKLKYNIIEDAKQDEANSNDNDVNFITKPMRKFTKDKTLISFRRWNGDSIGEIALYDFVALMNINEAEYGILFVTVELSQSAKSYINHNDKITVHSKNQFNEYLIDEMH